MKNIPDGFNNHLFAQFGKLNNNNLKNDKLEVVRWRDEYKGKDAAKIIKQILDDEGISQKELAEKMGCVRQNVSQMLNRGKMNLRYDSFYKMLDILGFEIIIRKKKNSEFGK